MEANPRIFVAGHGGLAGSAIVRALRKRGFENLVTRTHAELDLCDQAATRRFIAEEKPDLVIIAAARVGGILANSTRPAEFIEQNLMIQSNVIHGSWTAGVKRLLFLGSSCIYPRDCPQPIREEYLLTGPLEPTNRAYALAKIAGIEMCASYNKQYGTRYLAVMPTNLYGPGDNYDLQSAHVLPALIRKCHEAKMARRRAIEIWGTGKPRREFLHCDDLGEACALLVGLPEAQIAEVAVGSPSFPLINVGVGEDLTIAELASLIAKVVGFEGESVWDRSKPDGTPQKLLEVSRMRALGWRARFGLEDGIADAYSHYLAALTDKQRHPAQVGQGH